MDHNRQDKSAQFGGFFLVCSFLTFVVLITLVINNTLYKKKKPILISDGAARTLVITRSADNHFHIDAKLNNITIELLIDTGASYLTIAQELANKLQLNVSGTITAETANGDIAGSIATIDNLNISGIILQDVKVMIVPNMPLDRGLLGINVLKHFNIVQNATEMALILREENDA